MKKVHGKVGFWQHFWWGLDYCTAAEMAIIALLVVLVLVGATVIGGALYYLHTHPSLRETRLVTPAAYPPAALYDGVLKGQPIDAPGAMTVVAPLSNSDIALIEKAMQRVWDRNAPIAQPQFDSYGRAHIRLGSDTATPRIVDRYGECILNCEDTK